jgi:hypothetical protein
MANYHSFMLAGSYSLNDLLYHGERENHHITKAYFS